MLAVGGFVCQWRSKKTIDVTPNGIAQPTQNIGGPLITL
jgi:hypothetical protein